MKNILKPFGTGLYAPEGKDELRIGDSEVIVNEGLIKTEILGVVVAWTEYEIKLVSRGGPSPECS